jgi:hypothetical protein
MSQEDTWKEVAHECPLRLLGVLHETGVYFHCTSPRVPGKVLCIRHDSDLPDNWEPTEAQATAWKATAQQSSPARPA